MKSSLRTLAFAGLAACLPLEAMNVCPGGGISCISVSSGQNALSGNTFTTVINGENGDVSPYSGTLNQTMGLNTTTTSVTLYCDDANNNAPVGSYWNVNISQVTGNLSNTKFDTNNPVGGSGNLPGTSIPIPTGTTLYEEDAWLYTQMMNLPNPGSNTATLTAMQEAAWELTSNGETNSEETAASPWLAAAFNAVANNGQNGSSVNGVALHIASYADWYVFTDTASPNNSGSTGNQEFLTFFASGAPTVTTPEPNSWWLLGNSLLIGLALRLRHRVVVR
jgi:hypothetical protein